MFAASAAAVAGAEGDVIDAAVAALIPFGAQPGFLAVDASVRFCAYLFILPDAG